MKPTVVIVAGGLATRMKPITEEIPKCLIDINGKPLIQYQIEFFRSRGYSDFIFCVAHLADKVREYFGDGSAFSVRIRYSQEPRELLGTAGAVKLIENMVNETFIVYYGDNLTTEDFDAVLVFHYRKKSDFTILVRELPEGYVSSSIINLDKDGRISTFLEKPAKEVFEEYNDRKNYINNGIYVVEPEVLGEIPDNTKFDFAKDVVPRLMAGQFNVYGFVSNNFFREIGRIEKYEQFKKEFAGKSLAMNKSVFLDRDGVINKNLGDITKPDQFVLLDGAAEAIKKLNDAGFQVIVATNQPVIAKGLCTFKAMEGIHEKMRKLLIKQGAHIDAIYMCPHHPDKGFDGEVPELKIVCDCRKPKPGLLLRAMKERNIDPKKSWMVGDSKIDVAAGQTAGVKTILLTSGGGAGSKNEKAVASVRPDKTLYNLGEAAEYIIGQTK